MRAVLMAVVLATSLAAFPAIAPLAAQQTEPSDAHAGSPPGNQPSTLGAQPATGESASRVIEETELDRQTRAVAAQLRCVVCQGVSIQDSPSTLAQEMRDVVRERLAAGESPDEVKAYFVANYGEWVLLEPEPAGFNLLVYVLPVLMLIGGAVFVFFTARRMTRGSGTGITESIAEDEGVERVR